MSDYGMQARRELEKHSEYHPIDAIVLSRQDKRLLRYIRQALEKAGKDHEVVSGAREELLVQRERWRKSGKLVRDERVKTRDAESAFMNTARKFYHKQGLSLPPELDAAYQNVSDARDKLGPMEEDCLRAERSLTGAEWIFADKENEFYQYGLQSLLTEGILGTFNSGLDNDSVEESNPGSAQGISMQTISEEYRSAAENLEVLRGYFDTLRNEVADLLDDNLIAMQKGSSHAKNAVGLAEKGSRVLDEMTLAEMKARKLEDLNMQCHNLALLRRKSVSAQLAEQSASFVPAVSPTQTEDQSPLIVQEVDPKQRVQDWLHEALHHNTPGSRFKPGANPSIYDNSALGSQSWYEDTGFVSPNHANEPPNGKRIVDHVNRESPPNSLPWQPSQDYVEAISKAKVDLGFGAVLDLGLDNPQVVRTVPSILISRPNPFPSLSEAYQKSTSSLKAIEKAVSVENPRPEYDGNSLSLSHRSDDSPTILTHSTSQLESLSIPRHDSGNCSNASERGNESEIIPDLVQGSIIVAPHSDTLVLLEQSSKERTTTTDDKSGLSLGVYHCPEDDGNNIKNLTGLPIRCAGTVNVEEGIGPVTHIGVQEIPPQRPLCSMNSSDILWKQPEANCYRHNGSMSRTRQSRPLSISDSGNIRGQLALNHIHMHNLNTRPRSSSDALSPFRSDWTVDTHLNHDISVRFNRP